MGIYNAFEYGDGVLYGELPRLEFSAYPFKASAITYTSVALNWTIPQGDYVSLRIVRSLDGYPETQEDGVIVYEWNSSSGEVLISDFVDGETPNPPVASGRFVYYRIWVKKQINLIWKLAGDAITLVPRRHDSVLPEGDVLVPIENKVLDLLPRVFTSESQSPIDEVDLGSDLAVFLSGFSFMLDSILTYADLLLPDDGGRYVSPDIIFAQSIQLGLVPEAYIATKQQRRLIREALYIYQRKGTTSSVGTFVESLTGFPPDVTASPNLMLTPQDSSFTGGVGFWQPIGNCSIEAVNTVPTVSELTEPLATDYQYVGKVVVNEPGARISTGNDDPIRKGTPVSAGTPYTLSLYAKTDEEGGLPVIGYVTWYDQYGEVIRIDPPLTYTQDPQIIPEGSWGKFEFTGRAPGAVLPLLAYEIDTNVATITFGTLNVFVPGETVYIDGISEEFDGQYIIQNVGINTITLDTDLDDVPLTTVIGTATEASPVLIGPLETTAPEDLYPIAGNVTFGPSVSGIGAMNVEFSSAVFNSFNPLSSYLSPGDYLLIQGVSSTVDYGIHKILSVDTDNSATMTYYDINLLYTSGGLLTGITGFGKKIDVEAEAPVVPRAVYAGFETVFLAPGTAYVDMIQLATLDIDNFHEARGVEIFLNGIKTNYLTNPCFDPEGITEWTIVANDYDPVEEDEVGLTGNGYVLEVDTTALGLTSISANTGVIPSGKFLSASFYGKTESAGQTETLAFVVSVIDVTNFPTVETVATTTVPAVFTDEWQRFSARVFVEPVPAATVLVANVTIAGVTTGNTIYLDKAQLEDSYAPTDYFDGDLPASYGTVWEGEEHASPSHLYPNLAQKTTRLTQELKKYLATNQPYIITWHGGGLRKSNLY